MININKTVTWRVGRNPLSTEIYIKQISKGVLFLIKGNIVVKRLF